MLPEPIVTVLGLLVEMSLPIVTELDAEVEVTFEPIVTAFAPPVIVELTPITTALAALLLPGAFTVRELPTATKLSAHPSLMVMSLPINDAPSKPEVMFLPDINWFWLVAVIPSPTKKLLALPVVIDEPNAIELPDNLISVPTA